MEDRGYQFGDGVYEVVRLINGQFFTFDEHIDRLYESAAKIELVIPYSKDFYETCYKALQKKRHSYWNHYLQVTRGSKFRNLYP